MIDGALFQNKDFYLLDCPTYEDYLDTLIKKNDLKFLNNIYFARSLVQLGYRSAAEILTKDAFEIQKNVAKEYVNPTKKSITYFSSGLILTDPILIELQAREKPNLNKYLSTILFVSYKLRCGFEISSYIDFEQSLRNTNRKVEGALDWAQIFKSMKPIKPKPTDLSFYNWKTNQNISNNSENYFILRHPRYGLCFMHKGDRKIICTDPTADENFANDYVKIIIYSERFGYVAFYDHIIRRKL